MHVANAPVGHGNASATGEGVFTTGEGTEGGVISVDLVMEEVDVALVMLEFAGRTML
jgi:hypothetical protein